jgi:uncharacterized repeat protein (TIGR01451 family)
VVTTVDTGFDMSELMLAEDTPGNVSPGDSVSYSFQVTNLGNNAQAVPFTFESRDESGTTGNFMWELFHDSNNNGEFDTGGVDSTADTDVQFVENETDTIFLVVTAKSGAQDGDTLGQDFFATDNAPINGPGSNVNGASGDEWQDSSPVSSSLDERDTQTDFVLTELAAPELVIGKSIDSGIVSYPGSPGQPSYRPGDTIGYRITVRNEGSDTATGVEIVDAMPDSTTYVPSSAGNSNTPNGNGPISTGFDDDFTGNFGGSDNEAAERVKWTISEIGPSSQSNSSSEVTFKVTID